jgi:hypothetical protein
MQRLNTNFVVTDGATKIGETLLSPMAPRKSAK